jgi:hypothetical protein
MKRHKPHDGQAWEVGSGRGSGFSYSSGAGGKNRIGWGYGESDGDGSGDGNYDGTHTGGAWTDITMPPEEP